MSAERASGEPHVRGGGSGGLLGGVYGLGFIGAVVYFVQQAHTFGQGVLGVLKAIVWPAMLIYRVLETLKM